MRQSILRWTIQEGRASGQRSAGDSRRSGSRGRIVPAEVSASLTSGAIRAKRESSPLRRQRGHALRTAVVAVYLFNGRHLRGSTGERATTDTKAGEVSRDPGRPAAKPTWSGS